MHPNRALPTPDNLKYLKDQNICERLELMVRHLLVSRPEDPVLAMCNFINDTNRSVFSLEPPSRTESGANARHVPPVTGWRRGDSAPTSPNVAANSSTRGFPAAAAPSDSRRGSLVAASRLASSGANFGTHRLERDESARSDVSTFSVTSIDMAEFLADFRAAHYSLFLNTRPMISIEDLADVVDRIALPIPDTSLLGNLFHDMADASGLAPFEAFLARMNYRIAGKYHAQVVSQIFFSLVQGSTMSDADIAAFKKRFNGGDPDGDLAALVDEDHAVRSSTAATQMSSPAVSVKGANGSPPAAVNQAGFAALQRTTIQVHLQVMIESIHRGIGLRLSPREAEDILSKMGIHVENGALVTLHIVDLSRFLNIATSMHAHHSAAAGMPSTIPSVGAELNDMGNME